MRVFCSVLAVVGILSATETSAANWNESTTYLLDGMVDQLERGTIWQREFGEPEAAPLLLAEMRKRAKRSGSSLGCQDVRVGGEWGFSAYRVQNPAAALSPRRGFCGRWYCSLKL